jgi:hypothetical protein
MNTTTTTGIHLLKKAVLLCWICFLWYLPGFSQQVKPYDFPVKPGTMLWQSFNTHDEMVSACTVPASVLKDLSTEEILHTCLSYPLYSDIFNFDNIQQGFVKIGKEFNGFDALFARKDAGEKLLSLYQRTRPEAIKEELDLLENGNYIFRIIFIEMLLAQPGLIASLSTDEQMFLMQLALDADKAKEDLPHLYGYSSRISSILIAMNIMKNQNYRPFVEQLEQDKGMADFMQMGNIPDDVSFLNTISKMAGEFAGRKEQTIFNKAVQCSTIQTVKTPKNSSVNCQYYTCEPISSSQLKAGEQSNLQNYPKAIKIASGTGKYNCHSFSWYAQDSTNVRWINSPQPYWKDGSYTEVTPLKGAKYRWTYNSNSGTLEHTAIEMVNKGLPLTSKWGSNPLYAHDYKYVPYTVTNMKSYNRPVVTGSKDLQAAALKILLSPNPSNGIFTVTTTGMDLPATLIIYNISGQAVYSMLVDATVEQLNLSSFPKGIYTIRLINKDLIQLSNLLLE